MPLFEIQLPSFEANSYHRHQSLLNFHSEYVKFSWFVVIHSPRRNWSWILINLLPPVPILILLSCFQVQFHPRNDKLFLVCPMKHASVLVDVEKDHHIIPTDEDVSYNLTIVHSSSTNSSFKNVFSAI